MRPARSSLFAVIVTAQGIGCAPGESDVTKANSRWPQTSSDQQTAKGDSPETRRPVTNVEPKSESPTPETLRLPLETTGSASENRQPPQSIDEAFLFFPSKYPAGTSKMHCVPVTIRMICTVEPC